VPRAATGSRQRALLCRELLPRLSAQLWGPQFTPSVVDGPVTRAKWALGTAVPRVWAMALGRTACASPVVPGALCRELPLGTGCAESNQPCAEWFLLLAEARIPVVHGSPGHQAVPPVARKVQTGPAQVPGRFYGPWTGPRITGQMAIFTFWRSPELHTVP
jgi:hypothetical protein